MKDIAGLDLSLTSTGWACNGEHVAIRSKLVESQRLFEIQMRISDLVIESGFPAIVLEGYSFASKNSKAHSIGELGGVVKLALMNLQVPVVIVPPTVRAKFATGRGNASKNEVISAVSARTGIVWSGSGADDICDAYILEEMGRTVLGRNRHQWPKESVDALTKIDWTNMERYCE